MAREKERTETSRFMGLVDLIIKKIWDISKINVLTVAFYIPFVFVMIYVTRWFLPEVGRIESLIYTPEDMLLMEIIVRFAFGSILMTVPVVVLGPAAAGITRLLEAMVTRKPFFFWSDFWETFKKYFFKALGISLISTIFLMIAGLAINFYVNVAEEFIPLLTGGLKLFVLVIIFLVLLLFYMAHLYVYQLLIHKKLSILKAYRYAFVFAVLRFVPNLLILVACGLITVLPFYVHFLFGVVFYLFLSFGLCGTIINYFSWPAIHKHIAPMLTK
ncbi:MAG: DUF624 domain-containing protein [Clostridia bacterium]